MVQVTATLAERIAAWSSTLDLGAVPVEVVHAAKRCIVDTVGVSLAAAPRPLMRQVLGHVRQVYAPGAAGALGFPDRFSPVGAALVNGTAGHALDFDDTSYTGIMHGSTVVLPAALAATQEVQGDGRRLLEAFIAGSEVAYAVAMLCTTRHYFKGWWSTATFGVFGAAAAAARALGLSAGQTTAALALAGTQAGGQKAAFGTDAKPFIAGRTAALGVEAALLARRGLIGPSAIFEGKTGFLQVLNDGHAEAGSIDAIGKLWRLVDPGIFFKQYPVCSGAHAAVELTQQLLRENALSGDDVRRVICEVAPVVAISLVYDRPATSQEAQFSMPFAIGTLLARGDPGIDALSDEALSDPRMREAMGKVEMRRVDSLHTDEAPEGARVTLITSAGREFQRYLGQPTGTPGNPLTDERLHEKFLRCAKAGGIDDAEARALLEHMVALENASLALAPFWKSQP
ncbi:MAG: MmgE/PrpD family protein [Betaproteobacteria bacterium]|nr:MmgE/PrpD family protein [Betaproteobacteria bacterium]